MAARDQQHWQITPARRRGKLKERVSAGGIGLGILGGIVALVVLICLFRLVLLLFATSRGLIPAIDDSAPKDFEFWEGDVYSELRPGITGAFNMSGDVRGIVQGKADLPLESKMPEDGTGDLGREKEEAGVKDDNISEDMREVDTSSRRKQNPPVHQLRPPKRLKAEAEDNGPYLSRRLFFQEYSEMVEKLKVFVYPCAEDDPFKHIFLPLATEPSGNYASESYFKKALAESGMVTSDPSEADFFFMPFSITRLRNDPLIGGSGLQKFIEDYMNMIVHRWPYWNRTGGSDHFYAACHSIARSAMDLVPAARLNVIQVVCSANYYLQGFVPHKDVSMPQIWPRERESPAIKTVRQRSTLAFYAGGSNSPVRKEVVGFWKDDKRIHVYGSRISTPYDEALLSSKYCLHIRGFEVNTARLGDALFYGCVPVIIANHYELPFDSVLDWSKFSVIVTTDDIPKLKAILSKISSKEYKKMHSTVLQARRHFKWHSPPQQFDTFYMVMYQLWVRRHIVRYPLY